MTDKSTNTKAATAAKPAASPAGPATAGPATDGRPQVDSDCVVNEPFHVGRAVNGLVCSYHAMRYKADGTRR